MPEHSLILRPLTATAECIEHTLSHRYVWQLFVPQHRSLLFQRTQANDMRFLNTRTGAFIERDPEKTEFAILSHTWRRRGEQPYAKLSGIQKQYNLSVSCPRHETQDRSPSPPVEDSHSDDSTSSSSTSTSRSSSPLPGASSSETHP